MEEELDYVVNNNKSEDMEKKMNAKRKCYERYRTYIIREISINFVAPINNYWITYILDLIRKYNFLFFFKFIFKAHSLQFVEKTQMEGMMNTMLNEINEEYYDSVRKAILDYVLKDDTEKYRIGIM